MRIKIESDLDTLHYVFRTDITKEVIDSGFIDLKRADRDELLLLINIILGKQDENEKSRSI